jgi:hypothetical protein
MVTNGAFKFVQALQLNNYPMPVNIRLSKQNTDFLFMDASESLKISGPSSCKHLKASLFKTSLLNIC